MRNGQLFFDKLLFFWVADDGSFKIVFHGFFFLLILAKLWFSLYIDSRYDFL